MGQVIVSLGVAFDVDDVRSYNILVSVYYLVIFVYFVVYYFYIKGIFRLEVCRNRDLFYMIVKNFVLINR